MTPSEPGGERPAKSSGGDAWGGVNRWSQRDPRSLLAVAPDASALQVRSAPDLVSAQITQTFSAIARIDQSG
jgi:hypothetical protein